ncbi:MAG TPA: type IV pilus modification protein PilV [Pseudomonadales bacterium]
MRSDSHRARSVSSARQQRGFSMIELLVAVLVMGIGVLGVAALQMVSLQNNRLALERGEAVHLAYDVMDRLRANPGADYQIGFGDGPPDAPDCLGGGANCSPDQMRDFDLASWKCLLGDHRDEAVCAELRGAGVIPDLDPPPGLPGGDGAIENNGGVITVTVRWMANDGQQQTVVIDSQG